jgi:hypothetical protein
MRPQRNHKCANMQREEWAVINNLKRRPLIFLPSDKGGEFCVVEEERYVTAALDHLTDLSTYRPVAHMQARTIELK